MNGAELLARVARLYPDTLRIIVSGQDLNPAMQSCIGRREIHHYFNKQAGHAPLRACLQDWAVRSRD